MSVMRVRRYQPAWRPPLGASRGLVAVLAVAVAAAAGVGCGSNNAAHECRTDVECGGSAACVMSTCLPRASDRVFAVELSPASGSSSAPTELASVSFGADPVPLAAAARVLAQGSVTDSEGNAYASTAHIVASIPSLLPGRDPAQLETDMVDFGFNLGLSTSQLGVTAMLWLRPNAPATSQPPVPFLVPLGSLATDPRFELVFPKTEALSVLRGTLIGPLGAAMSGYVARALVGSQVVSSSATTDAAGAFQISIAPGAVPASAAGMVTVSFDSADATMNVPRLISQPIAVQNGAGNAAAAAPRMFQMPAFVTAAPLRFSVAASDDPTTKLSAMTVRFHTEIAGLSGSVAIYEREAKTDVNGELEVPLIPGNTAAPRLYQVVVMPAPDSKYAARCVTQLAITLVGNDLQPQYSQVLSLDRKVALTGTVSGGDGVGAAGVAVTATQAAVDPACAQAMLAAPAAATTDRNGRYTLSVAAGTYRIDVDPAAGAPLPRMTEDGDAAVSVAGDTVHDIALAMGQVVDGVVTAGGVALAGAAVKLSDLVCPTADACAPTAPTPPPPPILRARGITDAAGSVRMVVPASLP